MKIECLKIKLASPSSSHLLVDNVPKELIKPLLTDLYLITQKNPFVDLYNRKDIAEFPRKSANHEKFLKSNAIRTQHIFKNKLFSFFIEGSKLAYLCLQLNIIVYKFNKIILTNTN